MKKNNYINLAKKSAAKQISELKKINKCRHEVYEHVWISMKAEENQGSPWTSTQNRRRSMQNLRNSKNVDGNTASDASTWTRHWRYMKPVLLPFCSFFFDMKPTMLLFCHIFCNMKPILLRNCTSFCYMKPIVLPFCYIFWNMMPILLQFCSM